jgi:Cu/Zn superoxide dismutase
MMFAVSIHALGSLAGKHAAKMLPQAAAHVKGFDSLNIHGIVGFYETSKGRKLEIKGEIAGLEPNQIYAVHIHEFGSCDSPEAPGGHFNPKIKDHDGNSKCPSGGRKAGELPGITAGTTGMATINYTSNYLRADESEYSVIDRSIVIHKYADGKAGKPIACGLIQAVP